MVADAMSWVRMGVYGTITALFGTLVAVSAKMVTSRVPPFEQVLIRSVICMVLSPVFGGTGIGALARSQNRWWLAGRGIFGFLASMCYMEAVQRMPLISVGLASRMHMLVGPALVRLLYWDRVLVQQVVGYMVGVIGISMGAPEDVWKATHPYSFGFNYIMAATLSTGLSMHCVYKLTKKNEDMSAARLALHIGGVLGGLAFCALRRKVVVQPTLLELGYIAAGAVACSIMQLGLSSLYKHGKQKETAVFLFLVYAFSAIAGYFLGEGLPRDEETGGLSLIVLAVAFGYCGVFGHNGWEDDDEPAKQKTA